MSDFFGAGDIGQEYAFSLEFDGPTTTQKTPYKEVKRRLVKK